MLPEIKQQLVYLLQINGIRCSQGIWCWWFNYKHRCIPSAFTLGGFGSTSTSTTTTPTKYPNLTTSQLITQRPVASTGFGNLNANSEAPSFGGLSATATRLALGGLSGYVNTSTYFQNAPSGIKRQSFFIPLKWYGLPNKNKTNASRLHFLGSYKGVCSAATLP